MSNMSYISDTPFYIVTYNVKWVTTSWTNSMIFKDMAKLFTNISYSIKSL